VSAADQETETAIREFSVEPQASEYDVVVVGAGMGGLTAAALLAKAGMKVLLAEAFEAPGGYVHSFEREGYVFDPSVHLVVDPPMFERLLDHVGTRDMVKFIDPPNLYTAHFPGTKFHAPNTGKEDFVEAHADLFPRHAAEIRKFWDVCAQIHHEAHELPSRVGGLRNLDQLSKEFELTFKYRKATLQDALDEYLPDQKVQTICSAGSVSLGLPPRELSFMLFAQMAFSQIINGASYVEGGLQRMVDAFAESVRLNGGELVVSSPVTHIATEDEKVTGVRLESGVEIKTSTVISNADPIKTFRDLIGEDKAPASVMRLLRRLRMSTSAFIVYAATPLDVAQFDPGHLCYVCVDWDLNETVDQMRQGNPAGTALNVPGIVDPTVAPTGNHVLSAVTFAPYDIGRPWREVKPETTDKFLGVLDAAIPGVSENLSFTVASSPEDVERFTRNTHGAVYGWENAPDQTGSKRPDPETPIEGLYIAGSWTAPGAGFLRAVGSGVRTAELALARTGSEATIPRFMSAA
jgi:prolycopene isomerase